MQKNLIATLSVLSIALAGCSASTTVDDTDANGIGTSSSVSSGPFLDNSLDGSDSSATEFDISSQASSETVTETPTGQVRVIAITAANWEFSPAMIRVAKGEKVQLAITGDTGIHGFAVPGLGINVRVEAGKTVTIDLPTDTAGTFDARCSIPCGAGHKDMKMTIIVE